MFKRLVKNYIDDAIELSDFITDNPEVGSKEFKASNKHVDLLRKNGIKVEYPYKNIPTAFHGVINEGKKPRFGILVEYDALRGMGHACGHSASGAISTLAALMLNEIREEFQGEINIYGTPDEEINGGKVYLAKDGAFEGLDAAIMIHLSDESCVYSPMLALDAMIFEFFGTPSHAAAAPWEGKNAFNAMRLVFDAMDMIRQHVTDDVRMHGYIINAGEASNIVPDYCKGEFCVRGKNEKTLQYVYDWLLDIGKAAGIMTKTEFKMTPLGERFYELSSKKTGEELLSELFLSNGFELTDRSRDVSGSSDIGNVDYICPAFHPMISIRAPYKPHTVEFEKEMKTDNVHQAIEGGGIIIAEFLYKLSQEPEILNKIKEEHKKNRS
ncbi:MAG: M20 family metallopeptidase [Tissierellia bacterium]|nr:M20 family metallopeptidase [Tissierellia bacterium]